MYIVVYFYGRSTRKDRLNSATNIDRCFSTFDEKKSHLVSVNIVISITRACTEFRN